MPNTAKEAAQKRNDSSNANGTRKAKFWYWFGGGFVVLIGLALASVDNQYRHIPLRVSRETTLVTDPIKPDGKSIDDLAKMLKGSFLGPTD